jgi:membrane protein
LGSFPPGKRERFKALAGLSWRAYRLWDQKDCVDLSAAFAYHSLQSLFPILLIALAVASRILGRDDGITDSIIDWAARIFPENVLPVIRNTLMRFYRQGYGAGLIGILSLLVTSSNAYLSLRRGADRLWGFRSQLQPQSWQWLVLRFLRSRAEAFGLVALLGLFVVFGQLATSLRVFARDSWQVTLASLLPTPLHQLLPFPIVANLGLSLLLCSCVALALLRLLPSRRVPLAPLVPAALLVGLALTSLNLVLGSSLIPLGARFQAYGVIGAVLLLTLWVWILALIFYYGIALSVVLARPLGFAMAPDVGELLAGGRSTPSQGPD